MIGTGSSAIQAIPILAEQAAELYVFQRTPNYSMPARNGPLDPAEQAEVKRDYRGLRAANAKMPGAAGALATVELRLRARRDTTRAGP